MAEARAEAVAAQCVVVAVEAVTADKADTLSEKYLELKN